MKTNGFREIDFSKTECKNCGTNSGFSRSGVNVFAEVGKIVVFDRVADRWFFDPCPACKGTGFIDESVTESLLELDINPCKEVLEKYDDLDRELMKKLIPDNTRLK